MASAQIITRATHRTVLAEAAVAALLPSRDGGYIDATFGGGGHSRLILSHLSPSAGLLALDCDEYAAAYADNLSGELRAALSADTSTKSSTKLNTELNTATDFKARQFMYMRRNFSEMEEATQAAMESGMDCMQQVQGILFDLGMSSLQVDTDERGLSFMHNGPLDMRFDRRLPETAQSLIENSDEQEMARILRDYGEEPESRRLARAIVGARTTLTDTASLAKLVASHKRRHPPGRHPATLVFQALRIAVNREAECLRLGLAAACRLLVEGGRLAVIAFHSIEERIVKRALAVPSFPRIGRVGGSGMRQVGKTMSPSAAEISDNRRARSARMRVYEKATT